MRFALLALLGLGQDPAELKPGLVAHYRAGGAELWRVDSKPCFTWGDSSPHPRLPAGPFEVAWRGFIMIRETEPVRFGAEVSGEAAIRIDGDLAGETRAYKPGLHLVEVSYRSANPARLQVWWEGKSFAREPVPPWLFRHDPSALPAKEAAAEAGRSVAIRLGCARCHNLAFPGVNVHPPGPSLADLSQRVSRAWLLEWLADPSKHRSQARMPKLFTNDRAGFVERWLVADHLLHGEREAATAKAGDFRLGKRWFASLGCAACHKVPDEETPGAAIEGLGDRFTPAQLAAFLANPHGRYPDGRMPAIPMSPDTARHLAAYLLLWSKPVLAEKAAEAPVTPEEARDVARRLGAPSGEAGAAVVRQKRCAQCHAGIGESVPHDVPIRKPGDCRGAAFALDEASRKPLAAFLEVSSQEKHPSPFAERQGLLRHHGCFKCHGRDTDRAPMIEEVGSTLGGAFLQRVPFQRTPRLTYPHQKYSAEYLVAAVRDGVKGVRPDWYTYRMPPFGALAETLVRALAEGDGDLVDAPEPARAEPDPTLHATGPRLVGFEGYSCVSCHIWGGRSFSEIDAGAVGPELTTVARRIRRSWFDRWIEEPSRLQPGTPMPAIFRHGEPATLKSILDGDAAKQKEALWAYLAQGRNAPAPKPLPPTPIAAPPDGPLVAQVPVILPDKSVVESICVLWGTHDLVVYDVGEGKVRAVYTGARINRVVKGRVRQFVVEGTPVAGVASEARAGAFGGFDRLADGARVRTGAGAFPIRLEGRKLLLGGAEHALPPAAEPPPFEPLAVSDAWKPEAPLERPGYRAHAYPRPKTPNGEDLVMPSAVAVDPKTGRAYVASMKAGEIFTLDGDRFVDHARGLFQEAYSMLHDGEALYVLHRRNLTRVRDTDGDGRADAFDRVLGTSQAVADAYDYGYGLLRDRAGAWYFSYAPYGKNSLPGAGSLIRTVASENPKVEEVAYGFRNPLGWCMDAEGGIYYTDNQGEWVASNKLCHIVPGRFYGFPNSGQKEHAKKPFGRTAIWVPYAWAHSINGVAIDPTGGKFGPFAGQVFMAELMYGGAIVRAALERVNGEVQGACFPFWGKGLLGPVVLAFDPRGPLYVGSITEPGWMAQPDRGAFYRIDWTGETPFEIRSIHARPRGFRMVFTRPVDPKSAADVASYAAEHYRYEYTGSYGSPEMDRASAEIEKVEVAADGLSAELTLPPLVKERVYMISARGVKSANGEALVHPAGAYTLNEIPER